MPKGKGGEEFWIENVRCIYLHLLPLQSSQAEEEARAPLRVLRDSCTSVNEIPLITALAITNLSAQEAADYPQQVERLEKHVKEGMCMTFPESVVLV